MSQIRLANVTRVFPQSSARLLGVRGGAGVYGNQADRAFAERARSLSRQEADIRRGHGEDIIALDHVNLTIPDGQTFAVVGPSGCGKSTLLRVVCGLDTEYTGEIYYDDQDVRDVPPKDRYIGMVFQSYALYPHFQGEGNLRFFFMVRKAPDAEADERIRLTSQIMGFGFDELLPRKPGTLSGGQQQRLAIARALVRNPRLFLFDEPLSNLDAKLRAQTRVEIKRLLQRFRITAIYVTHDQEEAIALGDQIAIMREGRVEQVGPFMQVRDNPANAFVAGFLGRYPMNLFPGKVGADGMLHLETIAVPLPLSVRSRYEAGQEITLGIRPEAAHILRYGETPGDQPCLKAEVETIEPDFVRRTQFVRTRSGQSVVTAAEGMDVVWRVGDIVDVVFPVEDCYFFETTTGSRVV
jgi:ABC-type sugar transport system ATPase subunit